MLRKPLLLTASHFTQHAVSVKVLIVKQNCLKVQSVGHLMLI